MESPEIRNVVLIGAGNVAEHLGKALLGAGINIAEIFNRSAGKGEFLAGMLSSEFVNDLSRISRDADLYIIAVSDNGISEVVSQLKLENRMVVHTSGTIAMEALKIASGRYGVLYPLYSFSGTGRVDFKDVPVCLEASDEQSLVRLRNPANKISDHVYEVDSVRRAHLHLAAVFASNFSNFMYVAAEEILTEHGLSPELILPLIRQSAELRIPGRFFSRQTGPAVRGDSTVLEIHRKLLEDHRDYLEIYNLITKNIIHYKHTHG